MSSHRESGILLPVASLPSCHEIGDFGPAAAGFIDFLRNARQRIWQILPLNPVGPDGSPYFAPSSFAGNQLLISPATMAEDGFITQAQCQASSSPVGLVDYAKAADLREPLLDSAVGQATVLGYREEIDAFIQQNSEWLSDYALFTVLKACHQNAPWTAWDRPFRLRDSRAIRDAEKRYADHIHRVSVIQWLFMKQWNQLRSRSAASGIEILGDLPIYPVHDSADVWAHPHLFELDGDGHPTAVAGVPPDYFSTTGQRWGNPLYRWDQHEEEGFRWWLSRIERALTLYDRLRIDHFRGLVAYWAIPSEEETAIQGRWVSAPGGRLIDAIRQTFPGADLIAEDLGVIDEPVRALMQRGDIPGMRVLLFAFSGGADNPHLPHNHPRSAYVYTGTHDNPPVRGWYLDDSTRQECSCLNRYLGREITSDSVSDALVRIAYSSVARHAIIPIQDLLGLGSGARINRPGTTAGNWRWRLAADWPKDEIAATLRYHSETFGRIS